MFVLCVLKATAFTKLSIQVSEMSHLQPPIVSSPSSKPTIPVSDRSTVNEKDLDDDDDELVDRAFYTLGESEQAGFYCPDDKPVPKPATKRRAGGGGFGRDQDEWETALLVRSGAAREDGAWEDGGEDVGRAQVIVRANKPSFVKDTQGLVKAEMVDVVKDRSCDLAKAAEKGSMAVRLWREKTARGKMRHRYRWHSSYSLHCSLHCM